MVVDNRIGMQCLCGKFRWHDACACACALCARTFAAAWTEEAEEDVLYHMTQHVKLCPSWVGKYRGHVSFHDLFAQGLKIKTYNLDGEEVGLPETWMTVASPSPRAPSSSSGATQAVPSNAINVARSRSPRRRSPHRRATRTDISNALRRIYISLITIDDEISRIRTVMEVIAVNREVSTAAQWLNMSSPT